MKACTFIKFSSLHWPRQGKEEVAKSEPKTAIKLHTIYASVQCC